MASLLIRNVDATLHARLKASAASHRRSLEEEVRALLRAGLARHETAAKPDLIALARRLFGESQGIALDLPDRAEARDREPPDFGSE